MHRSARGAADGVIANLQSMGFQGSIFAVNPRYDDVLGYKCVPTIADLPKTVDCVVVATAADTACDVLDQAYAHGIRAAIVLSAGFGEGGHGAARNVGDAFAPLPNAACASAAPTAWG